MTVVITEALLLGKLSSASLAKAETVLVMEPMIVGATTMVTVAVPLVARVPRLQITVPLFVMWVPCEWAPEDVSGLMFELRTWWNQKSTQLSPVLSSPILHYRFEAIHPFADGNGRTGRALALWELYRRGFDTHHIFSVDEFYWADRPRYYAALAAVRREGEDLTGWLEYAAEGLLVTLEQVWTRVQKFSARPGQPKLVLRPRQEQLLQLLRDHKRMTPRELWAALGISKQGTLDLLQPLIKAGLVKRIGTKKVGYYILT